MMRQCALSFVLIALAIGMASLAAKPRSALEAKVKSQIMARVVLMHQHD